MLFTYKVRGGVARGVPLARSPIYLLATPAQLRLYQVMDRCTRFGVSMMDVLGMDVCAIGGRGGAIGGECGVLSRGLTACHRLWGGDVYCGLGCPRMSPTSGSAKYGATHGCHHLPGWRKCPPLSFACGDAVGWALLATGGEGSLGGGGVGSLNL